MGHLSHSNNKGHQLIGRSRDFLRQTILLKGFAA
jgi:hypothetical protein